MPTYKSVSALYAAVKALAPNSAVNLERVGPKKFVLGQAKSATQTSGFVYGKGFVSASPANPEYVFDMAEVPTRWFAKYKPSAIVGISILALITVGLLVKLIFVAGSAVAVSPKLATGAGGSIGASTPVMATPSASPSNSCLAVLTWANHYAQSAKSGAGFTVQSDQTIGGYRQITARQACNGISYRVLLVLVNHTWNAKSATPLESHSLN